MGPYQARQRWFVRRHAPVDIERLDTVVQAHEKSIQPATQDVLYLEFQNYSDDRHRNSHG